MVDLNFITIFLLRLFAFEIIYLMVWSWRPIEHTNTYSLTEFKKKLFQGVDTHWFSNFAPALGF